MVERRNVMLVLMRQNGQISDGEYAVAAAPRRSTWRRAPAHPWTRPTSWTWSTIRCRASSRTSTSSPAPSASTPRSTWTCSARRMEAVRAGHAADRRAAQKAAAFPRQDASRRAGGPGGDRPAHRAGQGPDRRAQLRHQPAEPRAGQAPAGLHLQAVRLRRPRSIRPSRAARASSPPAPPWWTSPPPSGTTASRTSPAISNTSSTAP